MAAATASAAPPRPELLREPAFRVQARELYRLAEEGRARAARAAPSTEALAATGGGKNVVTTGTVRPLALLVDFPDRLHNPEGHEPADYAALLFDDPANSATPPNTVREYFGEVSYGNLVVDGDAASVAPWQRLASPSTFYLGPDQGLSFGPLLTRDAILAHDAAVDFSLFDNDGPDGIPDSGDDDGIVDALLIVHAGWGWEDSGNQGVDPTGNQRLDFASHYNTLDVPTNDIGHDGQPIRVADYVLVPEESYKLDLVQNREDLEPPFFAVIDNGNEPLAEIGVYAHELGHVLGSPTSTTPPSSPTASARTGSWGTACGVRTTTAAPPRRPPVCTTSRPIPAPGARRGSAGSRPRSCGGPTPASPCPTWRTPPPSASSTRTPRGPSTSSWSTASPSATTRASFPPGGSSSPTWTTPSSPGRHAAQRQPASARGSTSSAPTASSRPTSTTSTRW